MKKGLKMSKEFVRDEVTEVLLIEKAFNNAKKKSLARKIVKTYLSAIILLSVGAIMLLSGCSLKIELPQKETTQTEQKGV